MVLLVEPPTPGLPPQRALGFCDALLLRRQRFPVLRRDNLNDVHPGGKVPGIEEQLRGAGAFRLPRVTRQLLRFGGIEQARDELHVRRPLHVRWGRWRTGQRGFDEDTVAPEEEWDGLDLQSPARLKREASDGDRVAARRRDVVINGVA